MSTKRRAPLAVGGLIGVGLLDLWLFTGVIGSWASSPATVAAAAWKPNMPARSDAALTAKPTSTYVDILAHPLFFKTREPFVPPPPPPPPATPKSPVLSAPLLDPGMSVVGIVISASIRKAYLMSKSARDGAWVREGEQYNGWRLRLVTPASATVERDGRPFELHLYPQK